MTYTVSSGTLNSSIPYHCVLIKLSDVIPRSMSCCVPQSLIQLSLSAAVSCAAVSGVSVHGRTIGSL